MTYFRPTTFLRGVLAVDALSCAAMGLGLAAGANIVAGITALPVDLLRYAGIALIPGAEVNIREGAHVIVLGEVAELRRLDESFPTRLSEHYEPTLREFLDVTDDFDIARIGAHMFRR